MRVFEPEREPDVELRAVLQRLVQWGGEAHYPPALHVLDRVDRGTVEPREAVEALNFVEILSRADRLADRAVRMWPGPVAATTVSPVSARSG